MVCVYHDRVPQALRIIRKSEFTPKPWKNGGGVTLEAIRVPEEGDSFEWRVSVAHIDASGPFSDFAAYNRKMVLLEGEGIELTFADGARHSLRTIGDLAEFDGAVAAECTLLGGSCVDLNLMVLKSRTVSVGVRRLTGTQDSLTLRAAAGESSLIFSIDAAVAVTAEGGETLVLEPWDLGVVENASVQLRRQAPSDSPGRSTTAVFFATIGH